MTFEPISYDQVRDACCELIAKGKGASRVVVQDIIFDKTGRRGSNSIVQGFINQFWEEAATLMKKPLRQVADVPDGYVAILDRALREMIDVSRKLAIEELDEREAKLADQLAESKAEVQRANDAAMTAEQLRLRAEGERDAMQGQVTDLRASLISLESRLVEETRKGEAYQQTIAAKDVELARQFAALEATGSKLEAANEEHRQEQRRLLKQVDDERQASKRDLLLKEQELARARNDLETLRRDLSSQREVAVQLKAELDAAIAVRNSQASMIEQQRIQLEQSLENLSASKQERAVLQVRFETADSQRQVLEAQCTNQAEELGQTRQTIAHLEEKMQSLQAIPANQESLGDVNI